MAVINPFRDPDGPVNPLRGSGSSNPFRESSPEVSTRVTYGEIVEPEAGLISFDKLKLLPVTEMTKGFWSSLTHNNIKMFGKAAEALSVATGNDKPEESIGRNVQNWVEGRTDKEDFPMSWEEAKGEGSLGVLGYLTGMTGSAVGSMAAPLALGAAGLAASGPLLAGAAALTVGAVLNIGETYDQLTGEGVDVGTASTAAFAVGVPLGAIDTLALGKVVSKTVGNDIKKKAIKELAKTFGKGYAEGAVTEGLTETAQSAIREATAAALTGDCQAQGEGAVSIA